MGLNIYPLPPKSLRNVLGEEGTEAFVEFLQKTQSLGRNTMLELSTERYERRLAEETGKLRTEIAELRAEMFAGFSGIQEQFKEIYKELARMYEKISDIQESINSQTKWIILSIFGAVPFYIALYKLLD